MRKGLITAMEVILLRRSNPALTIVFLCIIVTAVTSVCIASEGTESPIAFGLAVKEYYDDNIFLTKDDRVSDYITRVIPALNIAHKTERWDLNLYDEFYWWYFARQNRGYTSDYLNLSSKLAVVNNLLYFDVTDSYQNVVLNPRGPYTGFNYNVNSTDQNVVNARPYFKYQIDPMTTGTLGYTYTYIWYRRNGTNRQQNKGDLIIEHKFSPTVSASVGGEYLADMPQKSEPDNNQPAVYGSFSYQFTPTTRLDGKAGYRWIIFSGAAGNNSLLNANDYNAPLYNVSFRSGLPEALHIEISAVSDFAATPESGIAQNSAQQVALLYGSMSTTSTSVALQYRTNPLFARDPIGIGTTWKVPSGLFSIKGSLYHWKDKYIQISQTDEAFGLNAGFQYNPTTRLMYQISGFFEKDKFLPQDDRRTLYAIATGLYFKLAPKATLSLTYVYDKSHGDADSDNYFDNNVGLQIKVEL
jgi:hypothetical protein